MRPMESTK